LPTSRNSANHELFDDIEAIEKPVIAAVNGICAGGGVEMAVACDFRMAVRGARFLCRRTSSASFLRRGHVRA
jgi:enoyl-CoA hydratase/carnithine racemase